MFISHNLRVNQSGHDQSRILDPTCRKKNGSPTSPSSKPVTTDKETGAMQRQSTRCWRHCPQVCSLPPTSAPHCWLHAFPSLARGHPRPSSEPLCSREAASLHLP
ncbi:hypothetical protein DM01DRAFT_1091799 [Hesseltinella vesiculosa]|uniref:Uncharacterized protein n=1 Tax=Hesseltinella vesiculosa TaxID=101127 RepID=A0A1X2GCZ6_9FUNG|nr:hypothetical protein DM01DRAFT_1091799 [Hesseltinella vesiculosa]